ncbi:DegV family protein [Pseudoflavonifractor phocaeensis]|uniref:DegV family protein n=1 Tax=Pseudoflavonifractor phocaeensis TaxID=1870988 RepID=UPI001F1EEFC8|nr:DegV family protein [Pseudoflavonifractor phocaeensis]MCF2660860.1 DegV family protein [Pseudoflavonifractor phocaeensis]
MSDFVILTDSSADLGTDLIAQYDIRVLPLSFTIRGLTYQDFPDHRDMDPRVFYDMLRKEEVATTAAVNVAQYIQALDALLREGRDVLVLAFSSGLSMTYNASSMAAEELRDKYPDRKLYTVDTLCASLGQGLLVWMAALEREKGKSIEEVRDWVVSHKLNICHQFTVDDLHFLKRGGRISATTAVVGSMLQIKPVLHVDNDGRLVNVGKVRGRHGSLKALVDRMEQTAIDPREQTVFISHGDCIQDAELVAQMVKDRFGVQNVYINYVGPVIGAHSGPGTLALFYYGIER